MPRVPTMCPATVYICWWSPWSKHSLIICSKGSTRVRTENYPSEDRRISNYYFFLFVKISNDNLQNLIRDTKLQAKFQTSVMLYSKYVKTNSKDYRRVWTVSLFTCNSSYLTHWAIGFDSSDGFRVPVFATLLPEWCITLKWTFSHEKLNSNPGNF